MKAITKFNKKVAELQKLGEKEITFKIKGRKKVFSFYSGLLDEKRKELKDPRYSENLANNFYFKGYYIGANYQGDKNWYSYPEDYTFTISLIKTTNK
jgi:hypothetical protein